MRGLVLEGGGAKGAYEAGAIKALNKRKIKFDCVGGTSIGAINAACYVSSNIESMYKLWLKLDSDDLFGIDTKLLSDFDNNNISKENILKTIQTIKSIIKNKGIETTSIKQVLKKSISERKFRKSKIDFVMVTCNVSKFKPVVAFKEDIPKGKLIEYLLSSAYLPIFKLERIIDGSFYMDGGLYSNCPVDILIDKGYKEIYAIKAWQSKLKYTPKRGVKVHIITPSENLGSIMLFEHNKAQYRMNLGYYDTLKYLDKLDGNKYYLKNYSEKYYSSLFDRKIYKEIINKYNNGEKPKSNKQFIIKIIELVCKELNIERFRVYNVPFLISKLKYKLAGRFDNKYYYFIKNIKVDFE